LSVIAGFLSGALWLHASRIKVPINLVSGWDGWIGGLKEMSDGFKNQATWNSYAAVATALAGSIASFRPNLSVNAKDLIGPIP
jgi:hypothetical protein